MSNPPPTHHSPPQRPAGAAGEPDPERSKAAGRSTLYFVLLMFAAVLTSNLHLPWKLVSLAFAILAIVVGVRALVGVVRARLRGGLVVFFSLGIVVALLVAISQISSVAFWPIQSRFEQCVASALTDEAQTQCRTDFQKDLENLIPTLAPSVTPTR